MLTAYKGSTEALLMQESLWGVLGEEASLRLLQGVLAADADGGVSLPKLVKPRLPVLPSCSSWVGKRLAFDSSNHRWWPMHLVLSGTYP